MPSAKAEDAARDGRNAADVAELLARKHFTEDAWLRAGECGHGLDARVLAAFAAHCGKCAYCADSGARAGRMCVASAGYGSFVSARAAAEATVSEVNDVPWK